MKKLIGLIFCLQFCVTGCAMRLGGGSAPNLRSERLATEKGKLSELTDPVARTKSYIVIAELLLSFVADAAHDQDHDAFRALLLEYGRTIRLAKETILKAERGPGRQLQGYADLEAALRRQVRTLQSMKPGLNRDDQGPLDEAIQTASSIQQEIGNLVSLPGVNN